MMSQVTGYRLQVDRAYTLIEIVVGIAIILILALSMIWMFSDNAEEIIEVDKQKMELIRQKIESYQVKNDAYPTKILLATPAP
jgi:prepilin-type N-terminal cleavage/methylation domain-containing protein